MNTKISIIIPNFNRVDYLEQALQSMINQTYSNWEALVVDDGSSDGSKKMVADLTKTDQRIKWLERKEDLKGASVCRNMGIKNASGDFIIFLDSDDRLAPHCLEQRLEVMKKNPELDFAVFKMQFFKNAPGDDQRLWNLQNEESELHRFLKLDAVWQTSGPIWKRDALLKIGGFNPHLACWQDIDIHLKALFAKLEYKLCYDLPVDCHYRKDSTESISQSTTNSPEKLRSKIELYKWVEQQSKVFGLDSNDMALNILVSALNGYEFTIFDSFYNTIRSQLPVRSRQVLKKIKLLKQLRLERFNPINNLVKRFKSSLIPASRIGSHCM